MSGQHIDWDGDIWTLITCDPFSRDLIEITFTGTERGPWGPVVCWQWCKYNNGQYYQKGDHCWMEQRTTGICLHQTDVTSHHNPIWFSSFSFFLTKTGHRMFCGDSVRNNSRNNQDIIISCDSGGDDLLVGGRCSSWIFFYSTFSWCPSLFSSYSLNLNRMNSWEVLSCYSSCCRRHSHFLYTFAFDERREVVLILK